ncbi:hypothetical protein JHB64_02255 [Lacticaseibacillus rhamnosus]|uniref:Uncharacterized protein n=1 Tax=Lacticaseibacillus rhamnosus TaxID=47715 RepID=A0A853J1Y5_LACRH|nr:hypothetical protein [Lacticaseibacillus rhamnosus]AER64492.1 conserved hypothetical protein [Lacticaseibacillus rhamnosus ATCC 8530]AGP74421.1 Hypothetical protein LOCK908_1785 [Lacticaseibacillus rhamnosus LOCK908]MBS5068859.1 hypothetical protein [Lacticaseibacillus rhamnosus]MBZ3795291.1 hypothetical protein [Lacticaseibacillus rhamnosus]MCG6130663.1 hypothetical protein [Lacticaseibacillus rhamnosus]
MQSNQRIAALMAQLMGGMTIRSVDIQKNMRSAAGLVNATLHISERR